MADKYINEAMPADERAAHRGLDWLNLYIANIQTGFGAFIAIYLTSRHWTQADIGIALSIGTIAAMASQVPAGALVDAMRNKVAVAGISLAAFSLSALMFALWPVQLFVYLAELLHGLSSSLLQPAIAAISLGLVGSSAMGWRLGRNTRFSSLGNGIGAALMGAVGSLISNRSVFFLTAVLTVPAFFALRPLRHFHGGAARNEIEGSPSEPMKILKLAREPRLLGLCLCAAAFTFANAPLLPLAGAELTQHVGSLANILIGASIVVPQAVVVLISPWVGRMADRRGRKPMLIAGCCMLPLHGVALALSASPYVVVGSQLLNGVAASCFGIMIPLITSDIAGRSGHYTLALGATGVSIGIGASLATPAAGLVADQFGFASAFVVLAGAGVVASIIALLLRETRPDDVAAAQEHEKDVADTAP